MLFSGNSLNAFGRTALSNVGGSRLSSRESLRAVEPTDPLRDPISSNYREFREFDYGDREVPRHGQSPEAAGADPVRREMGLDARDAVDAQRQGVGGAVPIGGDPDATVRRMQIVRTMASVSDEPSSRDPDAAAQAVRAIGPARVRSALSLYGDAALNGSGTPPRRPALDLTA
jgi:hypothetical protein